MGMGTHWRALVSINHKKELQACLQKEFVKTMKHWFIQLMYQRSFHFYGRIKIRTARWPSPRRCFPWTMTGLFTLCLLVRYLERQNYHDDQRNAPCVDIGCRNFVTGKEKKDTKRSLPGHNDTLAKNQGSKFGYSTFFGDVNFDERAEAALCHMSTIKSHRGKSHRKLFPLQKIANSSKPSLKFRFPCRMLKANRGFSRKLSKHEFLLRNFTYMYMYCNKPVI